MKWKNLPQGWKVDRLANIAEISTGNPAPQGKQYFEGGIFPFVRVQDLGRYGQTTNLTETTDKVNERAIKACGLILFPKGTILFPKSGMSTLLNHRAILGVDAYVVSHLAALIPKKDIIGEYLYYYLCTIDMARWSQRTNLPSLRTGIISEIDIPIPPLPVQECIVAILQKADTLRQKQQEALCIAEQIIPSLFLEMFGDPLSNPMGWEETTIGDTLKIIRNGTTAIQNEQRLGYPVSRIETISYEKIDPSKVRWVQIDNRAFEKYKVLEGDILFSHINSVEHIAKTALYKGVPKNLVHGMNLLLLRPDRNKCIPEFLHAFLKSEAVRNCFRGMAKQAVNQASLNQQDIKQMPLPLPPIEKQIYFAERIKAIESNVINQLDAMKKQSSYLFNVLLTRSFTGELTASWEAEHAEEITMQVAALECLPRLTLLAFIRRAQQQMRQKAVLVTALMKYAFLFQMEGKSRQQLYNFVPYKFGPFAKEVYLDLNTLQDEGLLSVKKEGRTASREDVFRVAEEIATYTTARDEYYIEISIPYGKEKEVDTAIKELDEQVLNDIDSIINKYGHMDYDALLDVVYEKYPRFARRSQRKRRI